MRRSMFRSSGVSLRVIYLSWFTNHSLESRISSTDIYIYIEDQESASPAHLQLVNNIGNQPRGRAKEMLLNLLSRRRCLYYGRVPYNIRQRGACCASPQHGTTCATWTWADEATRQKQQTVPLPRHIQTSQHALLISTLNNIFTQQTAITNCVYRFESGSQDTSV